MVVLNDPVLSISCKYLPYAYLCFIISRPLKQLLNSDVFLVNFEHNVYVTGGKTCGVRNETWRTLFSCYLRFEIRPFAVLPTNWSISVKCYDIMSKPMAIPI